MSLGLSTWVKERILLSMQMTQQSFPIFSVSQELYTSSSYRYVSVCQIPMHAVATVYVATMRIRRVHINIACLLQSFTEFHCMSMGEIESNFSVVATHAPTYLCSSGIEVGKVLVHLGWSVLIITGRLSFNESRIKVVTVLISYSLELDILQEIAATEHPPLGGMSWLHSLKLCSEPVHVTLPTNTGLFSRITGPSIIAPSSIIKNNALILLQVNTTSGHLILLVE